LVFYPHKFFWEFLPAEYEYKDKYGRYFATSSFTAVYTDSTIATGSYLRYVYYDTSTNTYKLIARTWISKPTDWFIHDLFGTLQGNSLRCFAGYNGSASIVNYTKIK